MIRFVICIFAALCALPYFAMADDPFILLCTYGSGDFQSSKDLKVDVDMKMVDGQQADFTDTLITLERTDDGKDCHYEINRLNGDFKYDCMAAPGGSSIFGMPLTGQCKKAVAKEF